MKPLLRALAVPFLLCSAPAAAEEKVFDVHVHLWNGEKSLKEYEDQLKSTHQNVTAFGGMLIAKAGAIEETRRKNDELIDLAARHPEMMPIVSVHPYDGDAAIAELDRVAARGAKALKIHPHTQQFDVTDPRVAALCKEAGRLGITVFIDNANILPGDSENLFNLAVKLPKTRFVFTHMGGLNFRFWNIIVLARTAKDFFEDNIYFDISATAFLTADSPIEPELVWTIRNVGVDHVMIGSDFPQLSLAQAVSAVRRLDLTPEEKEKILYMNAVKLFGRK